MKYFSLNCLALILFAVDRILKIYFIKNPVKMFGGDFFYGLLTFHFEKNAGMAFGILFNQVILLALIILVVIILIGLLVKAYQKNNSLEVFALTLIIFGASSNLIDRLRYGYVVDYLDLKFFTVFNVADCLITFGVILFFIILFLNKESQSKINFDKANKLE